jgi:hypothetical protein
VERSIAAGVFAELSRGSSHVEYIVGDLERETEGCTKTTKRVNARGRGFRSDCTDPRRGTEQGAGLGAVEAVKLVQPERPPFSIQIEKLSADHASTACGAHQFVNYCRAHRVRQLGAASSANSREHGYRHHGEPSDRRGLDAKAPVNRGHTPAHVVIVHGRQIVVYKGVGMDYFDCRSKGAQLPSAAHRSMCEEQ